MNKQTIIRLLKAAGIDDFAPHQRAVVKQVEEASTSNVFKMMLERRNEFNDSRSALFSGIFADRALYDAVDSAMDRAWADRSLDLRQLGRKTQGELPLASARLPEIVIGSGQTAATYVANRVRMGYPRPIVLEKSDRAGGTFGMTRGPAFRLNSRNRPGELGTPGSRGALNVLPGATVQPSDLSGDEYQANNALGWAIRSTLATCANVFTSTEVTGFTQSTSGGGFVPAVIVRRPDGEVTKLYASRVIVATGLGDSKASGDLDVSLCKGGYTYSEFMRRMDGPFPLRGVKRVAVIGAGDGGRTVIEALTGQGPNQELTPSTLDYLESIDWYGVKNNQQDREGWRQANRSRYDGIGRLLPRRIEVSGYLDGSGPRDEEGDLTYSETAPVRRDYYRVYPTAERVSLIQQGYDGQVLVNGRRYDMVIDARGYNQASIVKEAEAYFGEGQSFAIGNRTVGTAYGAARYGVYGLGVVSRTPNDAGEGIALPTNIPENSVAIFRYADRTAQAAQSFMDELPARPPKTPRLKFKPRVNGSPF